MPSYRPVTDKRKDTALVIWMPLLLGIALAVGLVAGASLDGESPAIRFKEKLGSQHTIGNQLDEILRLLDYKYVEDLDVESLGENALKSLLKQLDPHSSYIAPDELQQYTEQSEGKYRGIGIEFSVIHDTVRVVGLVGDNCPARKAGFMPGDRILSVDGRSVSGIDLSIDSVTRILRGEKADDIAELEVLTFPANDHQKMALDRAEIEVNSVVGSLMLSREVAYLRLGNFTASAYRDFMEELEALFTQNEKAMHLVLDLRGNPGGYLDEAVKITSQLFKDSGKMIVYTEGDHTERKEYKTPGKVFFDINKVVILLDKHSASGSEVVAGAVQDWDRGLIIGESSFGKGLVQEQYNLSNGGAIQLTTAKYFTPSDRLIQKPYKSILNSSENEDDTDSSSVDRQPIYQTMIRKREVYGGGGIRPDIVVRQNIGFPSWANNSIQEAIFYCYKDNAEFMAEASNSIELGTSLDVMEINWEAYISNELGQWINELESYHQEEIRRQLNAELIRMKYGDKGKWNYLIRNDRSVAEALRMIEAEDPFQHSIIK